MKHRNREGTMLQALATVRQYFNPDDIKVNGEIGEPEYGEDKPGTIY